MEFGAADLLRRGDDLGDAVDHLEPVLIDGQAFEDDTAIFRVLLLDGDAGGEGIPHGDGAMETQVLAHIDGAGAGELVAEDGREERSAPHGMADHFMRGPLLGEFGVEVGRVDVAGDGGEERNVLGAQRARQLRRLADLDFVEGVILDGFAGEGRHGQNSVFALQHYRREGRAMQVL